MTKKTFGFPNKLILFEPEKMMSIFTGHINEPSNATIILNKFHIRFRTVYKLLNLFLPMLKPYISKLTSEYFSICCLFTTSLFQTKIILLKVINLIITRESAI